MPLMRFLGARDEKIYAVSNTKDFGAFCDNFDQSKSVRLVAAVESEGWRGQGQEKISRETTLYSVYRIPKMDHSEWTNPGPYDPPGRPMKNWNSRIVTNVRIQFLDAFLSLVSKTDWEVDFVSKGRLIPRKCQMQVLEWAGFSAGDVGRAGGRRSPAAGYSELQFKPLQCIFTLFGTVQACRSHPARFLGRLHFLHPEPAVS